MQAENLISSPIKKTYKVGVYGVFGFIGLSVTGFIAWSFSCLGGAAYEMASKLV